MRKSSSWTLALMLTMCFGYASIANSQNQEENIIRKVQKYDAYAAAGWELMGCTMEKGKPVLVWQRAWDVNRETIDHPGAICDGKYFAVPVGKPAPKWPSRLMATSGGALMVAGAFTITTGGIGPAILGLVLAGAAWLVP